MERTKVERAARSGNAVRQVAIAEDDDDLRSLLATMLRRAGFVVREFSSGSQLLRTLAPAPKQVDLTSGLESGVRNVSPSSELGLEPLVESDIEPLSEPGIDLVISDIRMPGASGLDVLATLHSANQPVPVVLMTAFGDRQTHEQALKMGAAALIDKPFELDELLTLANRLLPLNH
jgi:DNA-binding NtrC family response regulator